jgi:hypothetical protein
VCGDAGGQARISETLLVPLFSVGAAPAATVRHRHCHIRPPEAFMMLAIGTGLFALVAFVYVQRRRTRKKAA